MPLQSAMQVFTGSCVEAVVAGGESGRGQAGQQRHIDAGGKICGAFMNSVHWNIGRAGGVGMSGQAAGIDITSQRPVTGVEHEELGEVGLHGSLNRRCLRASRFA